MGLQDVLYEPASGEIFTPNTGVMTSLGKMALNQPTENGKIEARARTGNYNRQKNGQFGPTNGGKSRNNKKSSEDATEFKVKNFTSKQTLNNHWTKHSKQYISDGITTKEQYLQRALELVQSPCGNGIEGYKNKLGQVCRYDTKTNDYVKGHPDKGIFTMFKPESGKAYFDDKKKEGI